MDKEEQEYREKIVKTIVDYERRIQDIYRHQNAVLKDIIDSLIRGKDEN